MVPKGVMQASKLEKQLTVLSSNDASEPQPPPAWHSNPRGAVGTHTLLLTNSSVTGLQAQQEGNHAWHWKPGQLSRASEVTGLGRDSSTTTLLNQHNL